LLNDGSALIGRPAFKGHATPLTNKAWIADDNIASYANRVDRPRSPMRRQKADILIDDPGTPTKILSAGAS
ncbi:hypothetical protein, partial [Mesorhizobium amorphae]|uniref:hypothetical protein n=1 Tax=Mesorhizobium amorphae TaxID=71433 RepID=UPI001AEEAADF